MRGTASGICTMLWAIFTSALFSSNSWKPHQTGPSTIVFGSGSDSELRLKLLTPEREKEDTKAHR